MMFCVTARSHKLHLSLGDVRVRDCWTPATLFPLVVAPQRRGVAGAKTSATASLISSLNLALFRRGAPATGDARTATSPDGALGADLPLFELVYEKRPPGSDCKHRLKVRFLVLFRYFTGFYRVFFRTSSQSLVQVSFLLGFTEFFFELLHSRFFKLLFTGFYRVFFRNTSTSFLFP